MRPVAWSSSYLFRWPFGISTVTSYCTVVVRSTAARRDRRAAFLGVGTIASSGSTIVVTAKTGRFRRRMTMLALPSSCSSSAVSCPSPASSAARGPPVPTPSRSTRRACPSWATPPRSSPPSPRTRRPDPAVLTAELAPLLAAPALGPAPPRTSWTSPTAPCCWTGTARRPPHRRPRRSCSPPSPRSPPSSPPTPSRRRSSPVPCREVVLVGGGPDAVPDRALPDLPRCADGRRPRHPGDGRHAGRDARHPRRRRQLAVHR